jgi:hypothetical protein
VLLTFVEGVSHELRTGRAVLDSQRFADTAKQLAADWRITLPFLHPDALADGLGAAITRCSRAIHSAALGIGHDLATVSAEQALPSLADLLVGAQRLLSRSCIGLPPRWVLLFDDLEHLPDHCRKEILELIRALPASFGIKVAVTPLAQTQRYLYEFQQHALHSGHDFEPISLGYQDSASILAFTQQLHETWLSRRLTELGVQSDGTIETMLGASPFAPVNGKVDESLRTQRRPGEEEIISELSATQTRFRAYAVDKQIDTPERRASLTSNQRASRIRQAWPIMMLWHERLSVDNARQSFRSRKDDVRHLYTGAPTFQLLADGNPRINLVMLHSLIRSLRTDPERSAGPMVFSADHQSQAINTALKVQLSLGNAYLSKYRAVRGDLFALELFEQICLCLTDNVYYGRAFSQFPATTIKIDADVSPQLGEALVDMVYTGLLVDLTRPDEAVNSSILTPGSDLRGRIFRPSYLVSANNWLPIRIGNEIGLSSVLQRVDVNDARRRQGTIF